VSTLVRTFAVVGAFDAARKQRAKEDLLRKSPRRASEKLVAELSGGGTEVFSGRIGRVFRMPGAG